MILWLAFFNSAFGQGSEFESAIGPAAQEIDLSAWGFRSLTPTERFTFQANVSVHFLDNNHLLLTFKAQRKLMLRPQECPPNRPCRLSHAVILDLASLNVVEETDWYLHDFRPYLWPLSPGHILMRKSNSLYELDSDLHEKLLKDFSDDLLWANITADGKQIIAETALEGFSGAKTEEKQQTESSQPARVKIDFLNPSSLAVERSLQAAKVVELDATSTGYADLIHNVRDNVSLVRFGPSPTQRQRVARVKSPCEPDLLFPTNNTVLIGRCSSDSRDYNVSVFTVTGHPLWREKWPQLNYFPSLTRSEDGSRFAIGTVTASRGVNPPRANVESESGWPDVEQDIRVFETASGKLILAARVKSVVLKNPNYALASDGSRFALLDGQALRIYNLPTVSADERAKYLAMAADAPGLAPPAGNSSEVNGDAASTMGDLDSDDAAEPGESALRAALPKTSTTPDAAVGLPTGNSDAANSTISQSSAVQTTTTAREPPPATLIKAVANEVVVDVTVTDSKGHPVKGLPLTDFQIEEDRRAQKIKYFHEVNRLVEAAAPVEPVKPTPNVFSNNTAPIGDKPLVAVVLDFVNTSPQDQQSARDQLLKFLRKKPRDVQFAILLFDNGLKLLNGFTADENMLEATVNTKKTRGRFSSQLEAGVDLSGLIRMNQEVAASDPNNEYTVRQLVQLQAESHAEDLDRRVADTIDAFKQLTRYLDGFQGRKNVVWLSGSFPAGFFPQTQLNVDNPEFNIAALRNYTNQLREMTNQLAKAHIAVYPVDVRGLNTSSVFSADSNIDSRTPPTPGSQAPALAGIQAQFVAGTNTSDSIAANSPLMQQMQNEMPNRGAEQSTLNAVADGTGGKAFYNSNGIQLAIETAVELGSSYYMISYTSDNTNMDGKFRRLRVSLAQKGYHLTHRPGYFADPQGAPIKDSNELLREVGSHGMQHGAPDSHQLVFAVRVVPVGKPVKGSAPQKQVEMQHYAIDYAIAGPQLALAPNGEMRRAILDLMISAFTDDGSNVTRAAFKTTSDLKPAAYRDMIIGGLRMHQEVDVPVNAVSMRLGVLDELSRHLGTLELPLPLKAPPDDPATHARKLPPIEPD
jgi:VWFA-related protein